MNEINVPKISVIVPVYNVEKYIHQCIDSILGQTFADFELLLIDDGSPDNCGIICDEYAAKDSRVRVFHQENAGVSVARNNGLEESVGEWILFVDGDDWLSSSALSFMNNNIVKQPKVDLFQFSYTKFLDNSYYPYVFESKCSYLDNIYMVDDYFNYDLFMGAACCSILRKSIISTNNIRFISDLKLAEDQIFLMTASFYSKYIQRIAFHGYYYRFNHLSATNNYKTSALIYSIKQLILFSQYALFKKHCNKIVINQFILLLNTSKVRLVDILNLYFSSLHNNNIRPFSQNLYLDLCYVLCHCLKNKIYNVIDIKRVYKKK